MAGQSKILNVAVPFVFVILWSTGFVLARLTVGHVEPVSFLAFRFPVAGGLLVILALSLAVPWPGLRDATHAAVAGLFLHAGYLAPIYWAVAHGLPGGVSALIVGLQPLIAAFLAGTILKERVTALHWLGLAVGLAGVALVLAPKFSWDAVGGITPLTAGLAMTGAFSVALGTVYQKRFVSRLPLVTSVVWQYVGASIAVIAVAALIEDFGFDGSWQAWFGLGWSVIVLSLAAIFLLMLLIREGAVARVSALIFLVPGCSALMTYVIFNETLNFLQIIGIAVTAAAVMIVNRGPGAASA